MLSNLIASGYTPGKGVVAELGGDVHLAGNEALLTDHGIGLSVLGAEASDGVSPVFVARGEQLLGVIEICGYDSPRGGGRGACAPCDGDSHDSAHG